MLPSSNAHVTNDGNVTELELTTQPPLPDALPKFLLPPTLPPQAPAIPTPPINRRHSHNPTARKPIRSSPLAGPALSIDESNVDLRTDALKSRILSSPDLPSLAPPSPVRFARPKSSQGLVPVPNASGPVSSLISPLPVHIPSRPSVSSGPEHRRSKKRTSQYHAEFSDCPPIPEYVPSVRPKSAHGELEARRKSIILSTTTTETTRENSSGSSWLTANPYEVTPRFTRLGLSSSHVILPISAREHKRIAKARSSSSIDHTPPSGSNTSKQSANPSTPSLSSSSSSSSSASSPASSSPNSRFASNNSSASSSSVSLSVLPVPSQVSLTPSSSMCTITENDKSDDRSRHLFSLRGKSSTLARMRSLRFKGSKSHNDINAHTFPSFKAFDFGSVRCDKEDPVGLKITKNGDGTAQQTPFVTVEQVREPEPAVLPMSSKKKGTVRRFWRTISAGSWARQF